jgi:copper oxidase (laccase) domain-containing protein
MRCFHSLVFLDVPYIADWQLIQKRREQFVDEARRQMNLKRHSYDYVISQQVLKNIHAPTKLGLQKEGPYIITQVHTNGNITMRSCIQESFLLLSVAKNRVYLMRPS